MNRADAESQQADPSQDYPADVGRFDWEALIDRAELPKHLKTVAYVLAHRADGDGSHVRPGIALVADILDDSEKTTGDYINRLVELGWLRLVKKGGGTRREGKASVYQLTTPGPAFPMRLEAKSNIRLIERPKGRKPQRKSDPKPTSAQIAAETPTDLKPASPELPVDNLTDLKPASGQNPVDNVTELKPTSGRSPVDNQTDLNPASGEPLDRPEVERRPTRSGAPTDLKPASDYQYLDHPDTNTPRVVLLGGNTHLGRRRVFHKANEIDLVDGSDGQPAPPGHPEAPEPRGALPAPPTVTDAEYADAYEVLGPLPDFGQFLIARAAAEYAAAGWSNLPTKVLAVRAAQLAQGADVGRRSA